MEKNMADLNEYILEIRFKPNSKILDCRGLLAKEISGYMKLPEWRIVENRIDIFDEKQKNHAYVGFRNAGFVTRDAPTKNYFPDQAIKYFKYLLNLQNFEKILYVERIGVRSKFCKQYEGDFNELKEKYITNYLTLTEKAKNIIDSELLDIGGSLNFKDKIGNFNTMSGPMSNEQIIGFFKRDEDEIENFPPVGLYFDIDYWDKPKKELNEQEIIKYISQFANSTCKRFEDICNIILTK